MHTESRRCLRWLTSDVRPRALCTSLRDKESGVNNGGEIRIVGGAERSQRGQNALDTYTSHCTASSRSVTSLSMRSTSDLRRIATWGDDCVEPASAGPDEVERPEPGTAARDGEAVVSTNESSIA